jgi:hypothetical protein
MKGLVLATSCAVLAITPGAAAAATLWASPNGSAIQACNASTRSSPHSLSHGIDCLRSGDTLILLNGTYNLTSNPGITLDYDKSGTASAHTVIKSDTKWGAKLVYAGPGCLYDPVNYNNSVFPIVIRIGSNWPQATAFIDIIDLDISSAGGRGGSGIGLYGHDSIVQGNRIHDMNCNQSCQDGFNFGVVAGGFYTTDGNHQIVGNYIFNISPYAAGPCMEDDAIFYQQMHGRIVNNIILHNGGAGIQLRCNAGGTADSPFPVMNNTITNIKGGSIAYYGNAGSGLECTVDAQHPPQDIDYLVITNNVVTCGADPAGLYSYGIYEMDITGYSGLAVAIGTHNYVKNN